MPSFSGHFDLRLPRGNAGQSGACQVAFDNETFTLTPAFGLPLSVDLGDFDVFSPGELDLALTLYTGETLRLRQFGKAFQNLAHELLEAYRQRLVECLLLEDLEEVARFDGHAQLESASSPDRSFASPAELRLYRSNLAVLPTQATPAQWRLAEIDTVSFDEAAYSVTLHSGADTLVLTRLARRTREFRERVESGVLAIREKAAQALHRLLPFLTPGEFQQAAALLGEGQAASFARLNSVNARIGPVLYDNLVGSRLKPYCDALRALVPSGDIYTGFKFIREEEGEPEAAEDKAESAGAPGAASLPDQVAGAETEDRDGEKEPAFHWFLFPLSSRVGGPASLVAWEAASRRSRAAYFFRVVPPEETSLPSGLPATDSAVREFNRALVLLNFRREPIYLSDEKLATQPQYRRYAIACRKLPELRRLRASFVGRAIHTSFEAWQRQVEGFLPAS